MPHSKGADGNVFAYAAAGPVPEKRVFGNYILPGHNQASQIGDADYDKKEFAYDLAGRVEVATDQKGSSLATSDCLAAFPRRACPGRYHDWSATDRVHPK